MLKAVVTKVSFWICLWLSICLIIGGFIVPPCGHIDGSVLTAVGELFAFATLDVVYNAVKTGVDAKVRHGKTELVIGDLHDGPPPEFDNVGDEGE